MIVYCASEKLRRRSQSFSNVRPDLLEDELALSAFPRFNATGDYFKYWMSFR